MTSEEKEELLKLVSEGRIQQAIDQLLTFKRSESLDKEALAIASRYNRLKQKERSGVLSFEQLNRAENKITIHLTFLINHPEDKPYSTENGSGKRSPFWKYFITATIVIFILLSLAEVFNVINIVPSNDPLHLTVFVKDAKSNVAVELEGELNLSIGHRSFNKIIGEDGRTNFADIPRKYKGDTVQIGLKVEGWEITGKNTFVFTGNSIELTVKRDNSLCIIRGSVRSRDGQKLIEGAKVIVKDTAVHTDANGFFEIVLFEKMCVKKETDRYLLTVSKEGYVTKTDYYSPKSSDADIRLEKEKNK